MNSTNSNTKNDFSESQKSNHPEKNDAHYRNHLYQLTETNNSVTSFPNPQRTRRTRQTRQPRRTQSLTIRINITDSETHHSSTNTTPMIGSTPHQQRRKRNSSIILTTGFSPAGRINRSAPFNPVKDITVHYFEWINNTIIAPLQSHFFDTADKPDLDMRNTIQQPENRFLYIMLSISCIMYSFVGLALLCNATALKERSSSFWPWQAEGVLMMLLGIVSYMADIHTYGIHSYWHPMDRCFATVMCLLNARRVLLFFEIIGGATSNDDDNVVPYFHQMESSFPFYVYCFCGICLAFPCLFLSQKFSSEKKAIKMMIAHSFWHFFAQIGAFYFIYNI